MSETYKEYSVTGVTGTHATEPIVNAFYNAQTVNGKNFSGNTTIQLNTFGGAVFTLEFQVSVDGKFWTTATDCNGDLISVINATDAAMPFIFQCSVGFPRYYRIYFSSITGSLDYEIYKS